MTTIAIPIGLTDIKVTLMGTDTISTIRRLVEILVVSRYSGIPSSDNKLHAIVAWRSRNMPKEEKPTWYSWMWSPKKEQMKIQTIDLTPEVLTSVGFSVDEAGAMFWLLANVKTFACDSW